MASYLRELVPVLLLDQREEQLQEVATMIGEGVNNSHVQAIPKDSMTLGRVSYMPWGVHLAVLHCMVHVAVCMLSALPALSILKTRHTAGAGSLAAGAQPAQHCAANYADAVEEANQVNQLQTSGSWCTCMPVWIECCAQMLAG